jgi:diacylglycerol kinase (ATP)
MSNAPGKAAQRFSWRGRLQSFRHAGRGLKDLVLSEHNARVHLAMAAVTVALGLWLGVGLADWRWLIAAVAAVFMAEAFNTALERVCDLVSPQWHPLVMQAKDLAAAAVLVVCAAALLVGTLTLWPYAMAKLS